MTLVLELYILAMLDKGLRTPYELQREAGLSLGAIIPALRRLLKQEMVSRAEGLTSTNRPKHSYEITKAGRQTVESGWKEYLAKDDPPLDLDALLRLTHVAQQYGAKKSRLIDLLGRAAQQRLALASQMAAWVGSARVEPFDYRITRAQVEVQRLKAEHKALIDVAEAARTNRESNPGGKQRLKAFQRAQ